MEFRFKCVSGMLDNFRKLNIKGRRKSFISVYKVGTARLRACLEFHEVDIFGLKLQFQRIKYEMGT